jgi:hypothetical protein
MKEVMQDCLNPKIINIKSSMKVIFRPIMVNVSIESHGIILWEHKKLQEFLQMV